MSFTPASPARRPRTMIALWFVLVIGCVAAGGPAGTRMLTGRRVRRRAPGRPQWDHGRPAVAAAGGSHGS